MITKDTIIIPTYCFTKGKSELLAIQNTLIEFCNKRNLAIIGTLEYILGDYQQQDKIRLFLTRQQDKVTVVTNSIIPSQSTVYYYYDLSYFLNTLVAIGIINFYQVDSQSELITHCLN